MKRTRSLGVKGLLVGIMSLALSCQSGDKPRFTLVNSAQTGVEFVNEVYASDTLNLADNTNMYNGAGVGIGDLNQDGLPDLVLAGNSVPSKVYLNQGDFQFKDISEASGFTARRWVTGISLVDLNEDGLMDIYLSCSILNTAEKRANQLFLQRESKDGIPQFEEVGVQAGLADTAFTTQAVFFDYDMDGDLDAYCLTNASEDFPHNNLRPKKKDGSGVSTDRLYRNEGLDENKIPQFVNVSEEAGILIEGYGLGIAVRDFNDDGWPDIYVANDFITNDLLWINQQDGTFQDQINQYIKHTSYNGMGVDIADITNNGREDILVLDMLPENNEELKLMMTEGNYDRYVMSTERLEYAPQFVRNTLQLNMGDDRYSEVGQLSGIHDTHWSWAPLMVDFDNDGLKDIMITNGYPKNVIDLDYVNYMGTEGMFGTKESIREKLTEKLESLNEIKLPNYFYKNHGNAQFEDVSQEWGFTTATVSNGAAYGDLDQDGDLDLVVHNINQSVMIYHNQSQETEPQNYLQLAFKGNQPNTSGIGASLQVWTRDEQQLYTHVPFRGFQSSMEPIAHFGLGSYGKVDSLKVRWPDGSTQILYEVAPNQKLLLEQTNATDEEVLTEKGERAFQAYPADKLPIYTHKESPHVEFYQTPLVPHQMSMEGPGMAVGDVNGDGREDVYLSGASGSNGSFLIQQADGSFVEKIHEAPKQIEETGVLLFDADGDTDLDLYVVSGGTEHVKGVELYQDRLYKNDGGGNFTYDSEALPSLNASGSCVIADDYDQDGDLDLFVGGRVVPGEYPFAPPSYLLKNEGGTFSDVSTEIPKLADLGLVSAAIWTDYDEDGWQDLIVVGEWMPITVFHNQQGKLEKASVSAFENTEGWWNSILPVDVDRDGDLDYLVGNLGLNNPYAVSEEEPVKVFAKDFDANGTLDPIMAYHIQGELHIAHARDAINKQIVKMKKRFTNYASYAAAGFDQVILPKERGDALSLTANTFASCIIINEGASNFLIKPLPIEAQLAPLNGMLLTAFDEEGKSALIMAGNDYSTRVDVGPYDAMFGLMMETSDEGELRSVPKLRSGIDIPGDARGVVQLFVGNQPVVMAGQNDDEMRVFTPTNKNPGSILWEAGPLDQWVILHFDDGTKVKKALSYGGGFLSHSSRKFLVPATVSKLEVKNSKGELREITLKNSPS